MLTDADLSHNFIGVLGAEAISRMLAVNRGLVHLDLTDNVLTDYSHSHAGVTALFGAVATNATLSSLNLSSNGVGIAGCAAISNTLRVNTALESLNLSSNQLCEDKAWFKLGPRTSKGIVNIAKGLRTNKALRSLDLSDNELADAGVVAIARAL
eukprot:3883800-Prymnesium_polylepis.1